MMRSEGNYLRGNDDAMDFLFSRLVKFGQWYLEFCAYESLDGADCFHYSIPVGTLLSRSLSGKLCLSMIESRLSGKLAVNGRTNVTFQSRDTSSFVKGNRKVYYFR